MDILSTEVNLAVFYRARFEEPFLFADGEKHHRFAAWQELLVERY